MPQLGKYTKAEKPTAVDGSSPAAGNAPMPEARKRPSPSKRTFTKVGQPMPTSGKYGFKS